jgi:predicted metal-dependent hydrolase
VAVVKTSAKKSSTSVFSIKIWGVSISVARKNVKSLRIKISPPLGAVSVVIPKQLKKMHLKSFLSDKVDWIKQQQQSIQLALGVNTEPKNIATGEKHYFLGKCYTLEVVETISKHTVICEDDRLIMYVRTDTTMGNRQRVLEAWYRKELTSCTNELLRKWVPIVGEAPQDCRIKKMKTRWGSCNIRDRRIWLNLELIKKPLECIEYVLVHELVHFFERNHNARFHAYMDAFLPNWRETQRLLNGLKHI